MPASPLSFFELEPWDDAFDRETLAGRLSAPEFSTEMLADLLRIETTSVWTLVKRGKVPDPDHYEAMEGNRTRAVWRAEQLVGLAT